MAVTTWIAKQIVILVLPIGNGQVEVTVVIVVGPPVAGREMGEVEGKCLRLRLQTTFAIVDIEAIWSCVFND